MVSRFEVYNNGKFTGDIIKITDKKKGYKVAKDLGYTGKITLKLLKKKPTRPRK